MVLDKRIAGYQTLTMTDDSKPDQEPIPNPRPKRQPPIIDAEAKEIPPPGAASTKPDENKLEGTTSGFASMRDRIPDLDWRAVTPAVLVALLTGAIAGLAGAWMFASSGSTPVPADLSGVKNEISQLSSRIAQQEGKLSPVPDLAPLNERIGKLETYAGELRGELAELKKLAETLANAPTAAEIAAVNRRLAAIEERLVALATPKAETPRETPQPAEIVALGSLRDAIAAGAPFARELNAVRAILKERAAELAPFEKFAADGLPTVAALAKRFEPFASKIANPPPPDGGVVTRLWNNATRMIEIRPVGEPQGNEPGAVVARMETRLGRGDLAGALDEAKALSTQARELAKEWFETAERRRDAEALIKNLINAALASIAAERKSQ
jgi:hypothetical protein